MAHQNLYELNMKLTKRDLKSVLGKPDYRIIQTISALDELEESTNLFSERLREWYSLYYPELSRQIRNHESFAKVSIQETRKDSIGADLPETDLKQIQEFARFVAASYKASEKLSDYLDSLMKSHFPNLQTVAGSAVGAKLIAKVGNAERLSKLPSSTIQVLGAEKALFRHLKEGTKPPKYGIILNHSLLKNAPKRVSGKIARSIAAKISIAIKRDVYGGAYMGKILRTELEKKIKRILKK